MYRLEGQMPNRLVGDYVSFQTTVIMYYFTFWKKKRHKNMLPTVQISKDMVFKLTDPLIFFPPNFARF